MKSLEENFDLLKPIDIKASLTTAGLVPASAVRVHKRTCGLLEGASDIRVDLRNVRLQDDDCLVRRDGSVPLVVRCPLSTLGDLSSSGGSIDCCLEDIDFRNSPPYEGAVGVHWPWMVLSGTCACREALSG